MKRRILFILVLALLLTACYGSPLRESGAETPTQSTSAAAVSLAEKFYFTDYNLYGRELTDEETFWNQIKQSLEMAKRYGDTVEITFDCDDGVKASIFDCLDYELLVEGKNPRSITVEVAIDKLDIEILTDFAKNASISMIAIGSPMRYHVIPE